MGAAKQKKLMGFSPQLISDWEKDICINFAIALARITKWILHIDWLTNDISPSATLIESKAIPLRVYVGDNSDNIFDVRGIKTIEPFTNGTIKKLAILNPTYKGAVRTQFYEEEKISSLPLKSPPDEVKILVAINEIKANAAFLSQIPQRKEPLLPAYSAAQFTFGRCAPYAEALYDLTGLQPTALIGLRFKPIFSANRIGYLHSIFCTKTGMQKILGEYRKYPI